jgi:prepilin peptidase CpaA
VVLVVAAVTDVRSGKIYNALTYPALAVGLIGHTLAGGLTGSEEAMGLAGSLIGLAVGSALLIAWLAGGIGGGDAKLMMAVGALTGYRFTIDAMFWGFLVAALMAVGVIVRRRIARDTMKRIWRFLFLVLTPGKPADPAVKDSPKIPFGLALCIGSAVALAYTLIRGPDAQKLLLGI